VPLFRWFSPRHLVVSFLSQIPGFDVSVCKVKVVHEVPIDGVYLAVPAPTIIPPTIHSPCALRLAR
jgi:hypothetical protein